MKNVRRILLRLWIMLADSRSDVGHFWDVDQRRNGTEPILVNQVENGTKTAERVILNFTGSGHTVFRATSALERR